MSKETKCIDLKKRRAKKRIEECREHASQTNSNCTKGAWYMLKRSDRYRKEGIEGILCGVNDIGEKAFVECRWRGLDDEEGETMMNILRLAMVEMRQERIEKQEGRGSGDMEHAKAAD